MFARDPDPGQDGLWGTEDDDYGELRLQVDSPAIDAGNTLSVTVATDLAGNPRIADGDGDGRAAVDMGAYEREGILALTKTADPDPVTAGGTLTYTLTITNGNLVTATGVTLRDALPPSVALESVDGSCEAVAEGFTCALGALAPGDGVRVTALVDVNGGARGSITNTAWITTTETTLAAHTATVTTTVVRGMGPAVYLPLVAQNHVVAPDLVVEEIVATPDGVQVMIQNVGNAAVEDDFWVDVYVAPNPIPTRVNQTWPRLSEQGMVWGVTADLAPEEGLTLTESGPYYVPAESEIAWPLAMGTEVYAQIDSANAGTTAGSVLESHEITGGAYNNVTGTEVAAGALALDGAPSPETDGGAAPARLPPRPH
jgi:uncharacterized repeat protein (TIGR01451 family)